MEVTFAKVCFLVRLDYSIWGMTQRKRYEKSCIKTRIRRMLDRCLGIQKCFLLSGCVGTTFILSLSLLGRERCRRDKSRGGRADQACGLNVARVGGLERKDVLATLVIARAAVDPGAIQRRAQAVGIGGRGAWVEVADGDVQTGALGQGLDRALEAEGTAGRAALGGSDGHQGYNGGEESELHIGYVRVGVGDGMELNRRVKTWVMYKS